jgi:hypothetical protein
MTNRIVGNPLDLVVAFVGMMFLVTFVTVIIGWALHALADELGRQGYTMRWMLNQWVIPQAQRAWTKTRVLSRQGWAAARSKLQRHDSR